MIDDHFFLSLRVCCTSASRNSQPVVILGCSSQLRAFVRAARWPTMVVYLPITLHHLAVAVAPILLDFEHNAERRQHTLRVGTSSYSSYPVDYANYSRFQAQRLNSSHRRPSHYKFNGSCCDTSYHRAELFGHHRRPCQTSSSEDVAKVDEGRSASQPRSPLTICRCFSATQECGRRSSLHRHPSRCKLAYASFLRDGQMLT